MVTIFRKSVLFAAAIMALYTAVAVLGSTEEEELLAEIFSNYNRQAPPNKALNESIKVEFGIMLNKIQRVNEKENTITIMTWLKMQYNDFRLEWDPEKYGGLSMVRIPYQNLWLPDIVLYNGLTGSSFADQKITALVYSTGRVFALPPMLITASCQMDLALFPYDTQSCPLKFGSWSYDISIINLQPLTPEIEQEYYTDNPEWELTNSSLLLNHNTYPCCNDTKYADITVTLEISRRDGPYTVKLVIPSVLTAFLILFTFLLPSSSGEKIVFCLVLLLSLLLLLIYLHISVPSNSESVLGEFLTFALFLDFFATIIAVVCYNVADALLMRDKLGGPESNKHWTERKRKLKILRITEFVFFLVFLLIFIIGTAVILSRRG